MLPPLVGCEFTTKKRANLRIKRYDKAIGMSKKSFCLSCW